MLKDDQNKKSIITFNTQNVLHPKLNIVSHELATYA